MFASVALRSALIASLALVVAGCTCNDTNFVPQQPGVLDSDHGQWLSMDVAPDGRLVVTYYDRTRGAIGFAKGSPRDNGEIFWDHEEVDGYPDDQGLNPGDRGKFTSVAVAPDGRVWASYQDVANQTLRVGVREGGSWVTELADAGSGLSPQVGLFTSLELDASGNPVVAHFDEDKGDLRVTRRDEGGTWSSETVFEGDSWTGTDGQGNDVTRDPAAGMFSRLLIDGNTEYIAFYDGAQQTLNLLEGFPGAYTHTVVDAVGDTGMWPALLVDGDDLYIAYQRADSQDLMLAHRSGGGSFDIELVDDSDYRGADAELFIRDGVLSILYFDGHNNDMLLATQTPDDWSLETLAGDGFAAGYHNEVAFTHDRWWVACYDYTNRRIFAAPL